MRLTLAVLLSLLLAGCVESTLTPEARSSKILTMGDSLLSWNRLSGKSISHGVEDLLGIEVVDRSVPGAQVRYPLPLTGLMGMRIEKQYRPGAWDWVILNGGGNDLAFGCGCFACTGRMKAMISYDGTQGTIPDLVTRLRSSGAKVIYVGYLRRPGSASPARGCRDEWNTLEARLNAMAARDPGVFFLSNSDLVPYGDRSYHDIDMVHPSAKGSRAIAARIAGLIKAVSDGP